MKFVFTILMAACLQFFASAQSQGISLSLQNSSLSKAFKLIEQQSGYSFVYSDEAMALAQPVTIDVKNASLDDVLRLCFANQVLGYSVDGKMVIVKIATKQPNAENTLIDIRGKIVNEKNEPVAGATVNIENSAQATATDENGEFSLDRINENDILVVTSIGYYTKKVNANSQTYTVIRLAEQVGNLEETIIKGYYATSKRLNTGSVSKVTSKDIANQPVSNPLAALQGRVPGLLITQQSGMPGSNFSVLIRGQNSIQSGNSPLYIIDGVPFVNDADVLTQQSSINANNPFNTINPSTIGSIEILKDADATSIYGSRGANGVVLINTKNAQSGKLSIDINAYEGWAKVSRTMDYMKTAQYLEMRHEAFKNDGITPTLSNAYDLFAWDTTRSTDLRKLLIGNTARVTNATIRLSGGNELFRFSTGANYYKETTVFPGSSVENRISFDLSLSYKSNDKKFSATFSASYANDNSSLIRQDITQYINMAPDIPALYDSTGKLNWQENGFYFNNPLANTLRPYNVKTNRLTTNMVLNYEVLRALNLKVNLGYNELYSNELDKVTVASQNPAYSPTGSAFFGTMQAVSWIVEPQIEYSKLFNENSLQIQLGSSFQESSNKQEGISATGYTNDRLLNSTIGAQTMYSTVNSQLYRYMAVFGRINYVYANKYLVNLTGRRDGSSRFGPGRQFANFWATGAGWIFSQENFLGKGQSFLSYGKIRGSYGTTGNDLIGNYQYLDLYAQTQYPYQSQPSLYPVKLFNSDYSWERIRKLDIGLELGFIKDRITITTDWFKDKSDNQIIYYSLPGQTGFNNVLRNFPGVVQNAGFEFSVTSINIKNQDFNWRTIFNITWQKNKLLEFPDLENSSYAERYMIGKPLNAYIGAIFNGVDAETGIYQFLDKDKKSTGTPSVEDYVYLGTTDPLYYGGFQNIVSYKGWQLDFLFEFKKQKGIHPVYGASSVPGYIFNQPVAVLNRWQQAGDIAPYQRFTERSGPARSAASYLSNSSAVFTDASYIRFKNISLSYRLPLAWLQRMKIQLIRAYMEGQNLFVITSYKGADPENQTLRFLPPLKRFVLGLQVTF